MISIIGDIVEFLLTSIVGKILKIGFILLSFILIIIEIGYFKATGDLSIKIFFEPTILAKLALYYKREIAIIAIFAIIFFMGLYFYLQNKIAKRKNCALKEVELAEIAKLWLETEAYKKTLTQEIIQTIPKEEKKVEPLKMPTFKYDRSKKLFEFVNEYQEHFSDVGIEAIVYLLRLLEDNPVSSVAKLFEKDPNYKDYKNMVIAGVTSYDILSEVDLYTHTLNVVDKIIDYLETNNANNKILYLERAIIAALGHDIGKIEKSYKNVDNELFKQSPHNVISYMILQEKFPELNKEVLEAISFHHGADKEKKAKNYILQALLEADKQAREKEIGKWLLEHKKEQEKIQKEDKPQNQNEINQTSETEPKNEDDKKNEENEIKKEENNEANKQEVEKKEAIKTDEANNIEEKNDEVVDFNMDDIMGGSEEFVCYEENLDKVVECIKEYEYCYKKGNTSFIYAYNDKIYISKNLFKKTIAIEADDLIKYLIDNNIGYHKKIKINDKEALAVVFTKLNDIGLENRNCENVVIEEI